MEFCVACGRFDSLDHHHLVPRVAGGPDTEDNLITLCVECHARAHGTIWKDRRELQAQGIAIAKFEGKYKGRAPTARNQSEEVKALAAAGMTRAVIADKLGMSERSVYRVLAS